MRAAKLVAPRRFRRLLMQSLIVTIILDGPVWQQCPACSAAGEAYLLLDSKTQVLDEMKAIRHLRRLRGTFTSSLRVKPAPVSADDFDNRVLFQPSCNACHATVFENIHDPPAFEINDDRAVAPRFPPNADDPCRGFVVEP